jgi:hypothetical protein
MTGGQSTLFNENQNDEQNSEVEISKVDSNRAKIKVVLTRYATKLRYTPKKR